jgi:DNA polymerase III alpha subunit/nucleotidyltransferase/DNA polymerase involved in DNA repair
MGTSMPVRKDRSIVHLDADAFFASVEQAADPRLRGKAIAVGGEKRGIIASASYEARRCGIYTPMPTALARRLCPKLILLPGDFEKYELFSRLMFSYAYDFTPEVEIGSVDEGYFDLTGVRKPPVVIAETIRNAIRQSLKLPVSEGIASNKLISQIASKIKKPQAFQFVPAGGESAFLSPLANKWLPGVGPKTAQQLNAAGLAHIGQIAQTPPELLGLLVGCQALQLRRFSLGEDDRPVVPARESAKSYGEQQTFATDTTDEDFLEATLRRMADNLMTKVREDARSIRTVTVKVRYNDMDEQQAGESLPEPTDLESDIYSLTSKLLRKAWQRRVSLRLVSLKLSNLYDTRFHGALGLDAGACGHEARQRLADVVDQLRQKFGRGVVLRGHDFTLRTRPGGHEPSPPGMLNETPAPYNHKPQIGFSGAQHYPKPGVEFQSIPKGLSPLAQGCEERATLGGAQQPKPTPTGLRQTNHAKEAPYRRAGISPSTEFRFRVETPTRRSFPPKPACSTSVIPLNVHSYYSFLDSTLSIKAIVELAQRHEMPAIALTDKNNLHGAVEFAQEAASRGIKPIIAAEINVTGKALHVYVQNETGYHNLCHLLSTQDVGDEITSPIVGDEVTSPATGISSELLAAHACGLIAVSTSPALASLFPDRFYLGIDTFEQFEKSSANLPRVAFSPIHYAQPSDHWKYQIVQSIRTLTLLRQAHPEKRNGDFHFRTASELQQRFAEHPDLLAHSREIAHRCDFTIALGKPQFPSYPTPDGSTPAAFLHRLLMEGLRRRYPNDHARLKPQLEEELAIILEVGYEEYFLVMWDILMECRRRGIEWITRGSAADSLACYCLEISSVCPIRFDLYFRRFLNKDRMALNKLPDIDVDFPHDRKDDVIDLVFEKYGPDHAAVVGGFSTFKARSAFAEVAKVLGVSEFQVRRITERFPYFSGTSDLVQVASTLEECRDLPLDQEPYASALKMASFLDGFPRYAKMHPCGLVLSRQPIRQLSPTFISAKHYPTTHFDMDSVEAIGLVKMDILAQGGLAVMRDVKAMLSHNYLISNNPERIESVSPGLRGASYPGWATTTETYPNGVASDTSRQCRNPVGVEDRSAPFTQGSSSPQSPPSRNPGLWTESRWDSNLEPWEDPAVWDLIASGNARAVHHIESPAMISLCRMCNVRDIDTLIAIVSVIRPGAASENKKTEFARRYQGTSPVCYPHPSLEKCLRSTYGLVVYEEHILQICEAFAGLPGGRADVLRRALGKEKLEVIDQIQLEFAECARRLGRTETDIAAVWELVAGFRGYAFCKAHSTTYGVEAYQAAWLKLHYPVEFMAAVLTNGKGFYSPLIYILECHRLGIAMLPPFVNDPGPAFTVTEGKIRVPVIQLKGLSNHTKESLLRERERGPFSSLTDFFLRVEPSGEDMEILIRAGAFDPFGQPRTAQYWEFKSLSQMPSPGPRAVPRSQHYNHFDAATKVPGDSPAAFPSHPLRTRDRPRADRIFSDRRAVPGSQHSGANAHQLWLLPPGNLDRLPSVSLEEPGRLQRLRWEEELLGYPASGHPLELFPDVAWETYCPVNRLREHIGQTVVTCGLVIEQRLFHQVTGEPMKFLTLADWTGIIETELFSRAYRSYGLNTIRYRVLEVTATVEPFENNRGFTLRVHHAGKPRVKCAIPTS